MPFQGTHFFGGAEPFYSGVITTSLRFDRAGAHYLYRTHSASNRRTFTIAFWYKTSIIFSSEASDQNNPIFYADEPSGGGMFALNVSGQGQGANSDTLNEMQYYDYDSADSTDYGIETNRGFSDPSAWYHFVWAFDTTQAAAENRVKVYVNGVQHDYGVMGAHHGAVIQNRELNVNQNDAHWIGRNIDTTSRYLNGYLADFNFVDGTQYAASDFGEFKNGIWMPIDPSVTYGTNGFRLQFKQTGTGTASASTIGADTSGNDNHWTTSGIAAGDIVPDCPENNFCIINVAREDCLVNGSVTISEGGLQSVDASTTYGRHWSGTFGMSTGKWYWEVLAHTLGGDYANIGLGNDVERGTTSVGNGAIAVYYGNDGKRNPRAQNSGTTSYGATYTDGDIIGIAFDADNESVTFYKNGSTQGAVGSVLVQSTGPYFPSVGDAANGSTYKYVANWGQDGTFAGNKTAQGNADGSGIGDFYYSPPSGYLALCSANLSEPTIGPNSLTQSDDHFNTVLYTGNATDRNITGVGFQPDWVWTKSRSANNSHYIFDSTRGVLKDLEMDNTDAESTEADSLEAFLADGFSLGTNNNTNASTVTFVAWNWLANGGTTSSNSTGTTTSTVQANTTAGFSIVSYAGNASSRTVGHGLSSAPEWVIVKSRTDAERWLVFHTSVSNGYIYLNETFALQTGNADERFGDSSSIVVPSSTLITMGANNTDINESGDDYIMYCFHSVEGYSKFGKYTGNGNIDGAFAFTGFRPAWIMIRRTDDAKDWIIFDNKREGFNKFDTGGATSGNDGLNANDQSSEGSADQIDILSNGFKLRATGTNNNHNTGTFIYMAFAEAPFKYANAR